MEWQHVQFSELLSEFQGFLSSKLLQHFSNLFWLVARKPVVVDANSISFGGGPRSLGLPSCLVFGGKPSTYWLSSLRAVSQLSGRVVECSSCECKVEVQSPDGS